MRHLFARDPGLKPVVSVDTFFPSFVSFLPRIRLRSYILRPAILVTPSVMFLAFPSTTAAPTSPLHSSATRRKARLFTGSYRANDIASFDFVMSASNSETRTEETGESSTIIRGNRRAARVAVRPGSCLTWGLCPPLAVVFILA
ncbi:hypothetical protein B0H17DRAFT_1136537 [Mycena rosella]|uniref:Uncharacterized protein n=1 Tax=Mycena rosella TaxID=1033263 RepID=A0AAD7DB33_MYCRO|nr:hypothetical protein B0H17DRAFT_1136537 [Mycena rosella]